MKQKLTLEQALYLAAARRAERMALIQADIAELSAAGCAVTILPVQLLRLEDAGLLYDFESGLVEDHSATLKPQ